MRRAWVVGILELVVMAAGGTCGVGSALAQANAGVNWVWFAEVGPNVTATASGTSATSGCRVVWRTRAIGGRSIIQLGRGHIGQSGSGRPPYRNPRPRAKGPPPGRPLAVTGNRSR